MKMLAGGKRRTAAVLAASLMLLAPSVASAAQVMKCSSLEEAGAFRIRHLQSRLMVAALGCNQQAAYNTFVESFRPELVSAGTRLTDYFVRTGGGQNALNRHITELANAAGLSRAEDPNGYCKHAWELFWHLGQDPSTLLKIAEANVLLTEQPQSCTVTVATGAGIPPQNVTATFDAAKAAADKSK